MRPLAVARTALLCGLICLCAPILACRAQAPEPRERDEWAAILWGEQKIGFAHLTSTVEVR